jgi:hypothetical protein
VSQTYTPETIAAEIANIANDVRCHGIAGDRLDACAAAVRALAERQPAPEPERREHFVEGYSDKPHDHPEVTARIEELLNFGFEFVATFGNRIIYRAPEGATRNRPAAAPAVPAADAELVALRALLETTRKDVRQIARNMEAAADECAKIASDACAPEHIACWERTERQLRANRRELLTALELNAPEVTP